MTRAEVPQGFDGLVDEVVLQGLSVINSREPDPTALRFIAALENHQIAFTDITKDGYWFPNYRKYSGIYPVSLIVHVVLDEASGNNTPREFNGMFVAQEHRGSPQISVLATAKEVMPYHPKFS
jgi:hypothetical protein